MDSHCRTSLFSSLHSLGDQDTTLLCTHQGHTGGRCPWEYPKEQPQGPGQSAEGDEKGHILLVFPAVDASSLVGGLGRCGRGMTHSPIAAHCPGLSTNCCGTAEKSLFHYCRDLDLNLTATT